MNIPIYPSWEITENMVEFIKTFENDILKCFKNKNITMSSLISRKNNIDFIKVTNNNAIITTDSKDNILLNNFKVNGMIEMVLRISYIWRKDNKIGLESELYQIKYYSNPKELCIDFIDNKIKKETNLFSSNSEIKINKDIKQIENKTPLIKFTPPSILELSEMKNKLKGINKS
jgi:hypothetical protein